MRLINSNFIFNLDNFKSDFMHSHAQNPSPLVFDNFIRVYFNTRPKKQDRNFISYPTFIDLDINDLSNIIRINEKPVLELGGIGCFDEFGCMVSDVIKFGNRILMYYVGWTRCVSVPYNWSIGVAESLNGGETFNRLYNGPIISAQFNEPFLQNGATIKIESDNKWLMWYSSGKKWIEKDNKMESVYQICKASSKNGFNWIRDGKNIIESKFECETQTTPTVFKLGSKYHMIFSSRHSVNFRNPKRGYKLGYAFSSSGNSWTRDDSILKFENSNWDLEMKCYPRVISINGKHILFYCGNNFGEKGFGYAEIQK